MDDAHRPHDSVLGRLTGSVTGAVAGVVTGPLVDSIDPDEILERVDVNAVLERVDVNAVLDRVDVNRLLDRVDVNRLLDRVDVNRLLDRVDVDRLLARADVAALVDRSGVPDIVAQSTGRFAGSALDTARRQLLILDLALERVVDALARRHRSTWAEAPVRLRPAAPRISDSGQLDVSGRYAGPITRLVALIADVWLFVAGLTLLLAGLRFLNRELFPGFELSAPTWAWALAGGLAGLLYVFMCLESVGRTPGKALVGVRVVTADGATLGEGRALLRTLAFPVSLAVAGLGLLLVVVHPRQLALHDMLAHTAVVHDWSPRKVQVPEAIARKLVR